MSKTVLESEIYYSLNTLKNSEGIWKAISLTIYFLKSSSNCLLCSSTESKSIDDSNDFICRNFLFLSNFFSLVNFLLNTNIEITAKIEAKAPIGAIVVPELKSSIT